jgi:hypothetical protein
MAILLTYYQTFVDAVRATGGNNCSRTLVIQGPATDIDDTYKLMHALPVDKIADRLMMEVHYYTPYPFCLMDKDAAWGKMVYYWGKDHHSATDTARNARWGEENDVDLKFASMKAKFIDKGIPVIIGEFAAERRKLAAPSDQQLHDASVEYYYRYIVKSAIEKGLIPICWDVPMGLYNRTTCEVLDRKMIQAMMQGVRDASSEALLNRR